MRNLVYLVLRSTATGWLTTPAQGADLSPRTPFFTLDNADVSASGRVTDEQEGGLPGVNVVVKGTTQGTITDVTTTACRYPTPRWCSASWSTKAAKLR